MQFRVQSKTSETRKIAIELTIIPRIDSEGGAVPLNFRFPLSEIPCEIRSDYYYHNVLTVTKLDPTQDWGEFEWNFRVIDPAHQQSLSQPDPAIQYAE